MYINGISQLGIKGMYETEAEDREQSVAGTVNTELISGRITEGITQDSSTEKIRQNAGDTGAGMFTNVEATAGITLGTEKKQEVSNPLQSLYSQMTKEDYQALKEEGTPLEEYNAKRLEKALERIKKGKELREKSVDSQIETKKEKRERKEQAAMNQAVSAGIDQYLAEVLTDANLPVTKENIAGIKEAMEAVSCASNLTESSYQYIIGNEMSVTPDSIYKAVYSGAGVKGGGSKMEEGVMEELLLMAEQMLSSDGMSVSEKDMEDAGWLLQNNLPVNRLNIQKKQFLEQLKEGCEEKELASKLVQSLKNGGVPGKTDLMDETSALMESLVSDIKKMDGETVRVAIYRQRMLQGEEALTMQHLREAQDESSEVMQDAILQVADDDIEMITAKRQLEEIRLKLTMEAAFTMKEMGIEPEMAKLSEIVDGLREIENSYYQGILKEIGGMGTSSVLLKDTIETVSALKTAPAAVLSATFEARRTITPGELLETGEELKAAYHKAEKAYEPLMTVPRSDLGDSIMKAFENADSILEGLGQEVNESNRRAVRILAYNQIALTQENIEEMKAYDAMVNNLISNMKPAVTVTMIQEGINPLETSIEELNKKAKDIIKEQGITAEEKFSEYLVNLESKQGITAEEKNSYIGIYRLLHQVQKSDGAVIGAVVKAGQEVTLNNLLTAVRTNHAKNQDIQIDDGFGMQAGIKEEGNSISKQIHSAFDVQRKTDYMQQIAEEAISMMSPENAEKIMKEYEMYGELSLETLLDHLSASNEGGLSAYEEMKFEEMKELCQGCEEELSFLRQYEAADTIDNRKAAQILLNNPGFVLDSLNKIETSVNAKENREKQTEDFFKSMESRDAFVEETEAFCKMAQSEIEAQYCMEGIGQADSMMLQNTIKVLKLSKALAQNGYFNIPIVSGDTVTNINLTILHDQDEKGRISITLKDATESEVSLELTVTKNDVKCFVTAENEAVNRQLSGLSKEFRTVFEEAGFETKSLFFASGLGKKDTSLGYDMKAKSADENAVSTDALYQLSKQTIQMLMKHI
ncbi:MAG: hypothetical protein E7256_03395 [Lachnospiraceae bacterium]|nr:hypothetical protein [Lachnospiraceae bacterium]